MARDGKGQTAGAAPGGEADAFIIASPTWQSLPLPRLHSSTPVSPPRARKTFQASSNSGANTCMLGQRHASGPPGPHLPGTPPGSLLNEKSTPGEPVIPSTLGQRPWANDWNFSEPPVAYINGDAVVGALDEIHSVIKYSLRTDRVPGIMLGASGSDSWGQVPPSQIPGLLGKQILVGRRGGPV